MPLGIVSKDIFEAELEALHKDLQRGRGAARQLPQALRNVIAAEAITGDNSATAEAFDVSQSSVSAYKHGATSTASYDNPDESLAKHNDNLRLEISSKARDRLLQALNHITPEKLAEAKLRDVSAVAKDMASVISTAEPTIQNQNNGAQFIFFAPKAKEEKDYEVIDVT